MCFTPLISPSSFPSCDKQERWEKGKDKGRKEGGRKGDMKEGREERKNFLEHEDYIWTDDQNA